MSFARCMSCKDFLPFCELTFWFLDDVLGSAEVFFILLKLSLLSLLLWCARGVISKNLLPKLRLLKISSYVFLWNFIVLTLMVSCLIYFELILCRFWSRGAASFICMWISGGPAPFVERTNSFSIQLFWYTCQKPIDLKCEHFWTFFPLFKFLNSEFHSTPSSWSLYLSCCQGHTVLITAALWKVWKLGRVRSSPPSCSWKGLLNFCGTYFQDAFLALDKSSVG